MITESENSAEVKMADISRIFFIFVVFIFIGVPFYSLSLICIIVKICVEFVVKTIIV